MHSYWTFSKYTYKLGSIYTYWISIRMLTYINLPGGQHDHVHRPRLHPMWRVAIWMSTSRFSTPTPTPTPNVLHLHYLDTLQPPVDHLQVRAHPGLVQVPPIQGQATEAIQPHVRNQPQFQCNHSTSTSPSSYNLPFNVIIQPHVSSDLQFTDHIQPPLYFAHTTPCPSLEYVWSFKQTREKHRM